MHLPSEYLFLLPRYWQNPKLPASYFGLRRSPSGRTIELKKPPVDGHYHNEAENRDKQPADERQPVVEGLIRNMLVTFLAVAIMGFFAIITVKAEIMDPIRRTRCV